MVEVSNLHLVERYYKYEAFNNIQLRNMDEIE